jgi:hypothetical protein
MKLVTYDDGRVGKLVDGTVIELEVPTMRRYFEVHGEVQHTGRTIPIEQVRLRVSDLLCVGSGWTSSAWWTPNLRWRLTAPEGWCSCLRPIHQSSSRERSRWPVRRSAGARGRAGVGDR